MWDSADLVGKAKLYFGRALEADEDSEERTLWLLLGLEFLTRAPLAKIHPTLLAHPEGDSILHAAGISRAGMKPRSVMTSTVLQRLAKIYPSFGDDRAKDGLFLADLRNHELHSADAALANADRQVWMPKFLAVVEAVCSMLGSPPEHLVDQAILDQARTYAETADKKMQHNVAQLIAKAKVVFNALSSAEVAARIDNLPAPIRGQKSYQRDCPACGQQSLVVETTPGRATKPSLDENTNEIIFHLVSVATSCECRVCGLSLTATAQVMAAGIDRLHEEELIEDRYEGWEELMTYQDAIDMIAAGEDYGND
jgi:hypothetical protein